MSIDLDEYECGNLIWLLEIADDIGLNTGDWRLQILAKLETLPAYSPNMTPRSTEEYVAQYRERSQLTMRLGFAREGVAHWTAVAERAMAQRDTALARIRELEEQLAAAKTEMDEAVRTASIRFNWRHVVEAETVEAIAKWLDFQCPCNTSDDCRYFDALADNIRAGAWKAKP